MAKVIKCTSRKEAQQKAEAFQHMLAEGEQAMAVDEYLCIGKPGEWIETTRTWDGASNTYHTVIETNDEPTTTEEKK